MTAPAALDAAVLAHGGGAPETALIVVPLLVLLVFAWAERRARARERRGPDQVARNDPEPHTGTRPHPEIEDTPT